MENRWNETAAARFANDPKGLRVYTSRLLGAEPQLVLHGGGNTSVKLQSEDFFGDPVETLFVKGSGWDLATIEAAGFAPLRLDALLKLAALKTLSDSDMVEQQRLAMLDSEAPNASVEAILHAIIPFRFVDHTHANSVLALTNTANGSDRIEALYGDRVIVIPYVMPGFALARLVYEMTRDIDWSRYEGMILMNHGVFSFSNDGKESYDRMIHLVSEAEDYLEERKAQQWAIGDVGKCDPLELAQLRRRVGEVRGVPVVAHLDSSPEAIGFSRLPNVGKIGTRGPLTPDHSIFAKRIPVVLSDDIDASIETYASEYKAYFERNARPELACLDAAPRWAVWPGRGLVSFGLSSKNAQVISDIASHTTRVIQISESLGGWAPLADSDVFEVEYWELEQAKLKSGRSAPALQGRSAIVALANPEHSSSCATLLTESGAAVLAPKPEDKGFDPASSVEAAVLQHGGLDLLVTDLDSDSTCGIQEAFLTAALSFLKLGTDPVIVIVASGPSAEAFLAAKRLADYLQKTEGPTIRSCLAHSETGEAMLSASGTQATVSLPHLVRKLAMA